MRPRLRRWIGAAGTACLTVSAFCFASDTALRAAPLLAVRLHLPFAAPRLARRRAGRAGAAGSPSPAPAACSRRRRAAAACSATARSCCAVTARTSSGVNRGNRNGFAQSTDNYATALTIGAERRTERTSLSVTSAFGYGAGGLSAGSLIAGYRTPGVRPELRPGRRAERLAAPDRRLRPRDRARRPAPQRRRSTCWPRPTTQTDRTTYRVYGLRRNWNALGGAFSAGGYLRRGRAGRRPPDDRGLRLPPLRREALDPNRGRALVDPRGRRASLDGTHLATAFQADLQGKSTFTTLNVRYDPAGFQTLTGALDPGLSAELAVRRHSDRFGDLDSESRAHRPADRLRRSSTTTARRSRAAGAGRTRACNTSSGSRGRASAAAPRSSGPPR